MPATGVVVLAHGSRGERGKGDVEAALKRVAAGLRSWLGPETEIIGAALQFNHPDLKEAVGLLADKRVSRIVIAPYFLFSGRHITEHVPVLLRDLQHDHPEIRFILAGNLGLDESFIGLVAQRIRQAAPDLGPAATPGPAPLIEQESMEIITGLLPSLPALSPEEMAVVKRIVHASGDPAVAGLVRFSASAVSAGLAALSEGSPIFTDVRMVSSGISRRLADVTGSSVFCALDTPHSEEASSITRAAQAIDDLAPRLDRAIVVIGNAPTALLALLDLIDHRGIAPSLVVGMPVGFVQASESKARLMSRQVPSITVEGTRGGSAMAAATVNALLRIAADRRGIAEASRTRVLKR